MKEKRSVGSEGKIRKSVCSKVTDIDGKSSVVYEKEYDSTARAIGEDIVCRNWDSASDSLRSLLVCGAAFQKVAHQLGLELFMRSASLDFDLAPFYESAGDDPVLNRMLIHLTLNRHQDIGKTYLELYTLISRPKQATLRRLVICGLLEFGLWTRKMNSGAVGEFDVLMERALDHLSSSLRLKSPVKPYLDMYWELLFRLNRLEELASRMAESIKLFPGVVFLLESFVTYGRMAGFCPSRIRKKLLMIASIDPHHHLVESELFPLLEEDDSEGLIDICFQRLESLSGCTSGNDTGRLFDLLSRATETPSARLVKICQDRARMWSVLSKMIEFKATADIKNEQSGCCETLVKMRLKVKKRMKRISRSTKGTSRHSLN